MLGPHLFVDALILVFASAQPRDFSESLAQAHSRPRPRMHRPRAPDQSRGALSHRVIATPPRATPTEAARRPPTGTSNHSGGFLPPLGPAACPCPWGHGVGDPELLKAPGGIFARPRRMSTGKKNAKLKKSKRAFPPECGLRGQGPRLTMTRPVWLGHPRGAAEVRVARPRPGAYSEAASPARRAAAGPIWAGSGLQIIPTLPDCLLQTVW